MKIAHVADSHWGMNYPGPHPAARFEDITRTMDFVADRIIEEGCELVIFAGDAFKDARVFIDRATIEIAAFTRWLRRLSDQGIKVIVISGTPSHDAVSAYELIEEMHIPLVFVRTTVSTLSVQGMNIVCIPGMNRSTFATNEEFRGIPPHEAHQKITEYITNTAYEMASRMTGPTILVSHLTYDSADTGFEDALLQNEPILTIEAIQPYDLVLLGHIHRPQQVGKVFYSGAPERHNFGDEHTVPGFWIHDYDSGQFSHSFIETPARQFKTIRWSEFDLVAWIDGQLDITDVDGAMVRVQYSCNEDTQKRFDRNQLEKAIYQAGAYHVAEIKADVERTDRIRDEEVTESLGPLTALEKWGVNQGILSPEIILLQGMTSHLMEGVST
jgi:exonuclease SbcD